MCSPPSRGSQFLGCSVIVFHFSDHGQIRASPLRWVGLRSISIRLISMDSHFICIPSSIDASACLKVIYYISIFCVLGNSRSCISIYHFGFLHTPWFAFGFMICNWGHCISRSTNMPMQFLEHDLAMKSLATQQILTIRSTIYKNLCTYSCAYALFDIYAT